MKKILLMLPLLFWLGCDSGRESKKIKTTQDYINDFEKYSSSSKKSSSTSSNGNSKESKIKKELTYLNDITEIAWYEVDDNDVFIGFSPIPNDWKTILKGAALRANKKINFGVHVWALNSNQKGWRPGDGRYIGEVTARYGKIE